MSEKLIHAFDRGRTYYDGRTIDTSNYGGIHLEGVTKYFRNTKSSYETSTPGDFVALRNSRDVRGVIVRNVSGITLLPKRFVTYQTAQWGKRTDGYCAFAGGPVAGIVDDHLPAAGVPNGDLFWLITGGECLCTTSPAGSTAENFIVMFDAMYAQTAAASTFSTTAGRVIPWDTTSITTGTTAMMIAMNFVGRALSAKTSANSNADLLIDLKLQ